MITLCAGGMAQAATTNPTTLTAATPPAAEFRNGRWQAIAAPISGRLQRFFGVSRLKIDPLLKMIELSLMFMLMTFVVFVGYGAFSAAIRNHVISRPKILAWMRKVFSGAFAALAVSLAVTEK